MRAVNLLPREAPKTRERPPLAVQLAVVALFVVASLLAAVYLMANSTVNDKRATLLSLSDELASLPQAAPAPESDSALAVQHAQRISALVAALQGRVAWDRILDRVSSVLPEDAWLTTISAQSPQASAPTPIAAPTTGETTTTSSDGGSGETTTATPTPAPAPMAPLMIKGYTYSQEGVARLLSRLAVIPDLQDVKLIQSQDTLVAGRNVVSFDIQASVRPQATG